MKQWRAIYRPIAEEVRSLLDEYDSLLGGASRDPCDFLILRLVDRLSLASKKNRNFFIERNSILVLYLTYICSLFNNQHKIFEKQKRVIYFQIKFYHLRYPNIGFPYILSSYSTILFLKNLEYIYILFERYYFYQNYWTLRVIIEPFFLIIRI